MLEHPSDDQVLAQKLSDACTGKLKAQLKLKDRMIESLKDDIQKQRNGAVAELRKQEDQHEATIETLQGEIEELKALNQSLQHTQRQSNFAITTDELHTWTAAIKATTQETLLDQQAEIGALTDELRQFNESRLNQSPGPRSHSGSPDGSCTWSAPIVPTRRHGPLPYVDEHLDRATGQSESSRVSWTNRRQCAKIPHPHCVVE